MMAIKNIFFTKFTLTARVALCLVLASANDHCYAGFSCFTAETGYQDGYGYRIRDRNVYFWQQSPYGETTEKLVKDADLDSFSPVVNPYWDNDRCSKSHINFGRDAKHVFFQEKLVDGADPETFGFVDFEYTKDKNAVYFLTKRLTTRVAQFRAIDAQYHSIYATDGEKYFFGQNIIEEPGFEFVAGHPGYARTRTKVYYNGEVIVPSADAPSFVVISPGNGLTKDKYHVFYHGEIIPNADPKTFVDVGDAWFKDARAAYFRGKEIPTARPNSIKTLRGGMYAVDDNAVYKEGRLLPTRDPASFHVLGLRGWTRDKNGIYFNESPVLKADPETFHIVNNEAQDKNYRYGAFSGNVYCKFNTEDTEPVENCRTK